MPGRTFRSVKSGEQGPFAGGEEGSMKKPVRKILRKIVRKPRGYDEGGVVRRPLGPDEGEYSTEKLPGITSGAAPKPWGLNRDQPIPRKPLHESGFIKNTLDRVRPADTEIDPGVTRGSMPTTRDPMPRASDSGTYNPRTELGLAKGGKVKKVIFARKRR